MSESLWRRLGYRYSGQRLGGAMLAASIALAVLVLLPPRQVQAAPGDIKAIAGSVGQGQATTVAMVPRAVAAAGGKVYVADYTWHAVRVVDAAAGDETVVAGNGTSGFSGDGGTGAAARLNTPNGVAADAAGTVFIADYSNNRIRKVTGAGIISTVAGTGTAGYGGDGGPATAALLNGPTGVAVDSAGGLLIADTYNQRIRRIDSTGTISTLAGTGSRGFSGDGGPATSAQLSEPSAAAVDAAGNVWIADTSNFRIRQISPTGTISTYAGNGSRGFGGDGGPATGANLGLVYGVAVGAGGSVLIADSDNQRVRIVDSGGVIAAYAGTGVNGFSGDGGPATAARLGNPTGVAADGSGNVYVADTGNARIRKVTVTGTISTFAGNGTAGHGGDGGPAELAQFSSPNSLAYDSTGNLYVADSYNHDIRRVTTAGTITTVAGDGTAGYGGDGGPATAAKLNYPKGVAVDSAGNVFIADVGNNRIRRVDTAGTITTVAGNGTPGFSGDGGPATAAQLFSPWRVAVSSTGDIYICDIENDRIRRVSSTGTITTVAGNGTVGFTGDGGAATSAQLDSPYGVAVDTAGTLYIADSNNQRVRRVDGSGIITTIAGGGTPPDGLGDGGPATQGQLYAPSGLTLDVAGNLYIAESLDIRVRRVATNGILSTVAGGGSPADGLGDGGPATQAQLYFPDGVAIDSTGAISIADAGSNRIRRVEPGGAAAGGGQPPPSSLRRGSGYNNQSQVQHGPDGRHRSDGQHGPERLGQQRRVVGGAGSSKVPTFGAASGSMGFGSITGTPHSVASDQIGNQPGLAATDEGQSNTPPDTTGAIGASHYVEMVNELIGIYDRNLTPITRMDLATFVGYPQAVDVFDPQIIWDAGSSRWFYASDIGFSRLAVGWSKTADPSDLINGWCKFAIYTGALFHDYPKLGQDDNFILIGTNIFSGYATATAGIWAINKPPLGSSTCPGGLTATSFGSPGNPLRNADGTLTVTPVAVNTTDASSTGYVVAAHSYNLPQRLVMGWHMIRQADGSPSLVTDGDMIVNAFDFPATVPQPGVAFRLDAWDTRFTQAVGHRDPDAGALQAVWTQHTIAGPGGRSVVRWYELLPASLTVRQQGEITSDTDYTFNGAISPSISGNDAAIFFNRGSATQLVVIASRSRVSGTPLGAMKPGELVLGASVAADRETSFGTNCQAPSPCRWGDYAGASPDPSLPGVVWGSSQLIGPYADGLAQWVTRNMEVNT